jgi:hypothetical protein
LHLTAHVSTNAVRIIQILMMMMMIMIYMIIDEVTTSIKYTSYIIIIIIIIFENKYMYADRFLPSLSISAWLLEPVKNIMDS